MLFLIPSVVPVTLTWNEQEALPASVAPVRLTAPEPAAAVIVPAAAAAGGVRSGSKRRGPRATCRRSRLPVKAEEALGLPSVKLSEVEPFSAIAAAPN